MNQQQQQQQMERIQAKYEQLCQTPSDINEHLPVLFQYAQKCESALECGVRGCVSSWAIVLGLLHNENPQKQMVLNDLTPCDIAEFLQTTTGLGVDIQYEWKNDLELNLTQSFDLVFIDTWHIYAQLKRELQKFAPLTNKYIIMHDTTVDEIHGETVRCGWNAVQQSAKTGFPVEDIKCGLGKAIEEFIQGNPEWEVLEKRTNNNGLTVLAKRGL